MTMSKGKKTTPRLPSAPIDQCVATNLMDGANMTTLWDMYNYSSTMETTFSEPMVSAVEP